MSIRWIFGERLVHYPSVFTYFVFLRKKCRCFLFSEFFVFFYCSFLKNVSSRSVSVKSFVKIGLLSVSIPAVNIRSAFAWECSAGHEHKDDEICTVTGARPCPECEAVFHSKGEVCSETVFAFQRVDRKYVVLPYRIPDRVIAELWEKYGYGNKNRESDTSGNSHSVICFDDNHEMERLKCGIEKLEEKLLEQQMAKLLISIDI